MQSRHVTEEQIRTQAYTIYLHRGGQHGHDRDDWLQAEYELLQLPVRQIAALIFGPGEGELKKRLEHGKLGARIITMETADKMTNGQIAAKVRAGFQQ